MQKQFDVVVVGGGLAGACTAYRLAIKGYRVCLLEKNKLPRYKPCGGGMIARTLADIPINIDSVVQESFQTVQMNLLDTKHSFSTSRPRPLIHMVQRDELDFHIIRAATSCGTEVIDQCPAVRFEQSQDEIRIFSAENTLRTQYLVLADGACGTLSRSRTKQQSIHSVPAIEWELKATIPQDLQLIPRFDFGIIPGGYAWLFPKRSHLSMGLLTITPKKLPMKRFFEVYCKQLGLTEIQISRCTGHLIPYGQPVLPSNRILPIGDAAGLADPLTFEGMSFAAQSARFAAECIAANFQDPKGVSCNLSKQYQDVFFPEIRAGKMLSTLIYRSDRLRNWLLSRYGQKLCEAMVDVMTGKRTYHQELRKGTNFLRIFGFAGSQRD